MTWGVDPVLYNAHVGNEMCNLHMWCRTCCMLLFTHTVPQFDVAGGPTTPGVYRLSATCTLQPCDTIQSPEGVQDVQHTAVTTRLSAAHLLPSSILEIVTAAVAGKPGLSILHCRSARSPSPPERPHQCAVQMIFVTGSVSNQPAAISTLPSELVCVVTPAKHGACTTAP